MTAARATARSRSPGAKHPPGATMGTMIRLNFLAVTLGALAIAAALAGCASGPHGAAAPASPAPVPSQPADSNAIACRKFAVIAGPLTADLAAVEAGPAAFAAMPEGKKTLLADARLLQSWSSTTTNVVTGTSAIFLPASLTTASIGVRVTAAGLSDPGAAGYAQTAARSIRQVTTDCAAVLGG